VATVGNHRSRHDPSWHTFPRTVPMNFSDVAAGIDGFSADIEVHDLAPSPVKKWLLPFACDLPRAQSARTPGRKVAGRGRTHEPILWRDCYPT